MGEYTQSEYDDTCKSIESGLQKVQDNPGDGFRVDFLSRAYRNLAEQELMWNEDVEAARIALSGAGQVVIDYYGRASEEDADSPFGILPPCVNDAILAQLAGQHFTEAKYLSELGLGTSDRRARAEVDFDELLLPLLAHVVLDDAEDASERRKLFRRAANKENEFGFFTCLDALFERDAKRLSAGLSQVELRHQKGLRSYSARYVGETFSWAGTAFYNLGDHFGMPITHKFPSDNLADDLLLPTPE